MRTWSGQREAGRVAALLTVVTLYAPHSTLCAVEVKPVVNARLLGGQYYYNGADNAFGALASLVAAPYMKFNDRWSLVPLYSGNYRGTKQVADLLGGGTLFQDSQDHTVSTKLIRSFENGLKLKAVGGYGMEWLRETRDENWGTGLFDNRRLSAGTEAEYNFSQDQSIRLAYDYYKIRFPNYQSLESQQSASLGRELNQPDVLDNTNHVVSVGGQMLLPKNGLLELSASYTKRHYGDQHIVDLSGNLTGDTRHDTVQSAGLQGTWPLMANDQARLFSTLGYNWTRLFSNQNNYDASVTRLNPNYYAYVTQSITSQWTLLLGSAPWTLRLNGTLARQKYSNRVVQDATGAYGTDQTRVDSASMGLTVSYPIAKGFEIEGTSAFGWNDSNNTYTRVYQYHYNTATYLMGFRYAY